MAISGIAGNDPSAAIRYAAQSGNLLELPDGRKMTVDEFIPLVKGKSPQEMFAQFGPIYSALQQGLQRFF